MQWSEKVTTLQSGIHLRHYMSQYKTHNFSFNGKSEEKEKMETQQQAITMVQVKLINTIVSHQFTLFQWQNIHSILLFKYKHNRYLHQTRNIHIFQADYNLILKLAWGQAIQQSEKSKLINEAQFGCRKQKTAHDPVMIETLLHELTRITQQPCAQITITAQACFDRILPKIAIQGSRKYEVRNNILSTYEKTSGKTKYYIKLGLQVLDSYYGN
jgi:hypothetical protein